MGAAQLKTKSNEAAEHDFSRPRKKLQNLPKFQSAAKIRLRWRPHLFLKVQCTAWRRHGCHTAQNKFKQRRRKRFLVSSKKVAKFAEISKYREDSTSLAPALDFEGPGHCIEAP